MPRHARLSLPGIPWHIIQRGNNRSACFYADDDYHIYLETLKQLAGKYGCLIHAYVLMTNHVHLLLTPEKKESASLMMKHLGQRYVQYINRRYGRSGTLWEGRFRSCLTQDDTYVLACYRYIELNPLRAGMVTHPRDYPWSSYRVNAEGLQSEIISPNAKFLNLASSDVLCRKAYRELFKTHMDAALIDDIRTSTNGNFVLGDDRFKNEIADILERRVVPGKAGRPVKNMR